MMGYSKKFIKTISTSIFYLKFKVNNENDIAAHGICFDFYYWPKPRRIGQNSCQAFVDTRLAGNTQNTLRYLATYWANLPNQEKYLGHFKINSHFASAVRDCCYYGSNYPDLIRLLFSTILPNYQRKYVPSSIWLIAR